MLSNDEILEDLANELGRMFINQRISIIQNQKLSDRVAHLEEKESILLKRLADEIAAKEELANQVRERKINKRNGKNTD
jgi:hypothetical protein